MASAAKIVSITPVSRALPCGHPECSATTAELLAQLDGEELLAASSESSNVFNGLVLARAVLLVQLRIRCPSLFDMAQRMGVKKNMIYRWARGIPITEGALRRALQELIFFLDDPRP